MTDLEELRGYERFILTEEVMGSFGATAVCVVDLGREGAQIQHAQPLRVGTVARFWFRHGPVTVSSQALAVWSKLARQKSTEGKPVFRTGLRIEEETHDFSRCVTELVDRRLVHRDAQTLKRQRMIRANRAKVTTTPMPMKAIITPDQELLVRHVSDRLYANPSEAEKWAARAHNAVREASPALATELAKYPEHVIAVWEYLERTVPIWLIVRVLEK
jgi:hypothetical protein